MPKPTVILAKYQKDFEKHLGEVDELTTTILKGHLIVESAIDNIISLIFFNPDHVRDGRFSFSHKVQMARAYCLRKDNLQPWHQILALNALRNEIVHNLGGDRRDKKMKQLRRMYLAGASPKSAVAHKNASDADLVIYACADSVGFLANFEYDLERLREHLDALDATLNPGLERAPRKAKT